jgi:hypothetical protein
MSVQATGNAHVAQGTHVIFVVRHGCGERGSKCAVRGSACSLALSWKMVKVVDIARYGGVRLWQCLVGVCERWFGCLDKAMRGAPAAGVAKGRR